MCSYWIKRDQKRLLIGEAGRKRTIELGLTHEINIIRIINTAFSNY